MILRILFHRWKKYRIDEPKPNINRNINTLVHWFSIGSGKSHLLKKTSPLKKNIAFDDTDNIKKSLAQILLYLFKRNRLAMLWKDFTTDEINKKINVKT
jgi:hypothetical protein